MVSKPKSRVFVVLGILVGAFSAHGGADWEREYEQVRKIALRDARVRAAYAAADKKLEAKMLEIDPALKPYLESRRTQGGGEPAAEPRVGEAKGGWFSLFRSKPRQVEDAVPKRGGFQPREDSGGTDSGAKPDLKHEVAQGETLTGIAARYSVSAGEIQKANALKDPRKLKVGQVLVVPGGRPMEEGERREWDRLWDETVRH